MRQTELRLGRKDREAVEAFRTKGSHRAREVNRTHILSALDRKVPENQIRAAGGTARVMCQWVAQRDRETCISA